MKRLRQNISSRRSSEDDNVDYSCDDSLDKNYEPDETECDEENELSTSKPSTSKPSTSEKLAKKKKTENSKLLEPEVCGSKYNTFYKIKITSQGTKTAECLLCSKKGVSVVLKMSKRNTSGLKGHLECKHSNEFKSLFGNLKEHSGNRIQQKMTNYLKCSRSSDKINFNEDIVKWLSIKYLPFNFFDDQSTQAFFGKLNSSVVFPKRTAMKERVSEMFIAAQNKVLQILSTNESNISFTIDGWTSITNKSYYGITAHFVDQTWKMHSLVIDFLPSHGRHTGKDIANIFYECTKNYDLLNKIQGITMDNASANTTFLEELDITLKGHPEVGFSVEDTHFRCFAHIINLGIQDTLRILNLRNEDIDNEDDDGVNDDDDDEDDDSGLESNPSPILKIRMLFKKIKKSEQNQNLLKSLCDAAETKYLTANIDVSTRWNSTCDMLSRAVVMKKALQGLYNTSDTFSGLKLTDDEWRLLEIILKYLKYFKCLSTTLCGETYPTLALVVMGFNVLLDKLEKFLHILDMERNRGALEESMINAFQVGRDKMLKHYKKTNWVYCAALVLDPRHKLETFELTEWGKELKESSEQKVMDLLTSQCNTSSSLPISEPEPDANSSNDSNDEFLSSLYSLYDGKSNNLNRQEDAIQEFKRYCQSERAPRDTNILDWWKERADIFPNLSKIARDILGIPATSVPAERLFSKAGIVIRKHRNRLNAESARNLLCLNSWYTCSLEKDIFENLK